MHCVIKIGYKFRLEIHQSKNSNSLDNWVIPGFLGSVHVPYTWEYLCKRTLQSVHNFGQKVATSGSTQVFPPTLHQGKQPYLPVYFFENKYTRNWGSVWKHVISDERGLISGTCDKKNNLKSKKRLLAQNPGDFATLKYTYRVVHKKTLNMNTWGSGAQTV